MASIDLAQTLRHARPTGCCSSYGEQGEDVDVLNPDARHHIGVGLTHPDRACASAARPATSARA